MAGFSAYLIVAGVLAALPFPVAGLPHLRFGLAVLGDTMLLAGLIAFASVQAFVPDNGPATTVRWIEFALPSVGAVGASGLLLRAQVRAMRRSRANI